MITTSDLADTSAYFHVGVIAGAHALKGEVRVFPSTDDPDRFTPGLTLYLSLEKKKIIRELTVEHARRNGKFVLVKCKEFNRVEDVERLTGSDLYVSREDAIPLKEGEYYVADLIGLTIQDETGKKIGVLKDVISAPANDVYVMHHAETDKEVLIPAIKQCILKVDMENRVMTVHLLDGLLDL